MEDMDLKVYEEKIKPLLDEVASIIIKTDVDSDIAKSDLLEGINSTTTELHKVLTDRVGILEGLKKENANLRKENARSQELAQQYFLKVQAQANPAANSADTETPEQKRRRIEEIYSKI